MPSLADYSEGKYLEAGDHLVKVMSYKGVESKKTPGQQGIEFTLADAHGGIQNERFWLTDAALGRLKRFAVSCGLSDEALRAYDPFVHTSHQALVNHKLNIRVVKDGQYHNIKEWWSITDATPEYKTPPPVEAPAQQGPADKDIPF